MRLKDWAISQGIHQQSAYKWFKDGTLPAPAQRVGPKIVIVNPEDSVSNRRPWPVRTGVLP
ncbi:hypothetical protein [Pseudarthrobacter sp. H2]|uniref:hypothetical protein n=1 Tax=Pseudarthrobacter sp. H2 TaxID=3418415 RepID=UPI003CEC8178